MLNEALNVVAAKGFERAGDVVTLKEILDGGDRALVVGHTDEERIVHLADVLLDAPLRIGDSLLMEPRSGYVFERIPKSEVEELVLEEVPDIDYTDIGGLSAQIEAIREAGCFTEPQAWETLLRPWHVVGLSLIHISEPTRPY